VEKKRLQAEVNETKRNITDADSQLDELNRSLLETEANFFKEIHEVKDQVGELQIEREKLLRDLKASEAAIESRESSIEMLKDQLKSTRKEFDEYRNEMNHLLKQHQKEGDDMVTSMRQELRSVQSENDNLKEMNAEMKVKMLNVVMEMENVQKRNAEVMVEFENECQRLESIINEKNRVIEMKESAFAQVHHESEAKIEVMRKKLDAEKSILNKKIEDLENAIASAQVTGSPRSSGITTKTSIAITNRNASTSLTSSTSTSLISSVEDRDQYEQQIEFLNSVIVDMQKKNDELKSKLQIMQEFGDVSGFEEGAERILKMNGHRRPPRLFCDICDVFDLHETEDCPQQANLVAETNGHSKHNGRSVEREYCASCEVFGHSTKDCDDRQSY
jgi:CAP-Gly domain-containing linker protein 1